MTWAYHHGRAERPSLTRRRIGHSVRRPNRADSSKFDTSLAPDSLIVLAHRSSDAVRVGTSFVGACCLAVGATGEAAGAQGFSEKGG